MDVDERCAALQRIPLFAEVLNEEQFDALAMKAQFATFPEGATLMVSGDFGVSMYAIVEGRVRVSIDPQEGDVREVAILNEGDIAGEMSLMTGERRNADVTALVDVTALEITKVALEEILRLAPQLADRFGEVLAKRRAELDRIVADSERDAADLSAQIRRFFSGVFG